jgi:hypothetical protein
MALAPNRPPGSASERLRLALELAETAEKIMAQNLRRRNPDASEAELLEMLRAWLHDRPGAEHGDGHGYPRPHESR